MTYADRRLLQPFLLACAVLLGVLSATVTAAAEDIQGLQGNAAKAIETQIRAAGFRFVQVSVFYGDLTGEATNDAISFVYHDVGGSADQLVTWVWRETGGTYRMAGTIPIDEVFGVEPRNVVFSPGRITVTTTVLQGDDPHCCPTGERTFTVTAGGADTSNMPPAEVQRAAQLLDVAFPVTGRDGPVERCSSRTIVAGLDPNGEGFLAVRSGPGTDYRKIDELRNGDVVYSCDARGNWIAVVYGAGKSRKGWAHGRWLAG